MKNIYLSGKWGQGRFVLVDDEDFKWLSQYKWHYQYYRTINNGDEYGYATRGKYDYEKKKNKMIKMHREILNAPDNFQVDHKNGNPLDNRRVNLRLCHADGNAKNVRIRKDNTSGYKGVVWHKQHKKWYAQISINGRSRFIGLFRDKLEAVKAYNNKAEQCYGEYARLNII